MPSFNAHYHLSHEHRVFAIWEGYCTTNANTTHDSDREQSWTFRNSSASLLLCTLLLVTQCFCYPSFFLPVLPLSQSANANQSILLCHYLYRTCNSKKGYHLEENHVAVLLCLEESLFQTSKRPILVHLWLLPLSGQKFMCESEWWKDWEEKEACTGWWGYIFCDWAYRVTSSYFILLSVLHLHFFG